MAAISYMQRRRSGVYEFRKRLPERLAGKPAPAHMRQSFSDLINGETGNFRREFVRSLGTHDEKKAKTQNHREALRLAGRVEEALTVFDMGPDGVVPPSSSHGGPAMAITPAELGAEVYRELLAGDDDERTMGDDRRHLHDLDELDERSKTFPLLVGVRPPTMIGMEDDHAHVYGIEINELAADSRTVDSDSSM